MKPRRSPLPAFARVTDYERLYCQGREVCGAPFPEISEWFQRTFLEPVHVLDLGCGQGRDALVLAGLGHRVTAVDLSPSGIRTLQEEALRLNLEDRIQASVGDVLDPWPEGYFEVILMDRLLNMLSDNAARRELIQRGIQSLPPGGFLLLAVTAAGLPLVQEIPVRYEGDVVEMHFLSKGIAVVQRRSAEDS